MASSRVRTNLPVRIAVFLLVVFLLALGSFVYPALENAYAKHQRSLFLEELRPVSLRNCRFARFGGDFDGGYLLCDNLISNVQAVYSYGINGADEWGCDVHNKLGLVVHQYDCFNLTRPECPNARGWSDFHEECIGPKFEQIEKRPYDSLFNQVSRNKDSGKRILMKMDVEESEWESLEATPDELLGQIDQLSIEFHQVSNLSAKLALIRRLKKHFYIANIHFNNYTCDEKLQPLPAAVFQALFVNKRIAELDPQTKPDAYRNPLDRPDGARLSECQASW